MNEGSYEQEIEKIKFVLTNSGSRKNLYSDRYSALILYICINTKKRDRYAYNANIIKYKSHKIWNIGCVK